MKIHSQRFCYVIFVSGGCGADFALDSMLATCCKSTLIWGEVFFVGKITFSIFLFSGRKSFQKTVVFVETDVVTHAHQC